MTVFRVGADDLSLLITRPKALWSVRSHPGVQRAVSTAARIKKREDARLGFFNRAHRLLGSDSLIGVCERQGCDTRYLARAKIDVFGCDGLYMLCFDQGGGRVYGGLPIAADSG